MILKIETGTILIILYLQNVLRELEQKKPQLDDLVKTAESLRESPIKQQIPAKGKSFSSIGSGPRLSPGLNIISDFSPQSDNLNYTARLPQ